MSYQRIATEEAFATAEQMRSASHAARAPGARPELLDELLDGLAPWLAGEYLAVHGAKTSRPQER